VSEQKKTFVYISSWKLFSGSSGLGLYQFDSETGELEFKQMLNNEIDFGFSFIDQKRGILYIVNETEHLPDARVGGGGQVFAYKINPNDGSLQLICRVPTYCANPCYITLDATGKYMIVANHSSHSIVTKVEKNAYGKYNIMVEYNDSVVGLFPVAEDGSIGEPLDIVKHTGSGFLREQFHANPHSAVMSPSGKLFAVCDNGEDRIYMYQIDREKSRLFLEAKPFDDVPGSVPRYAIFHPTKPYMYVNHEFRSLSICCFRYTEDGELELIDTLSSMPEGYVMGEHDEQQDFRFHPSGKYIYDTIAGPNLIAVYSVDEQTGKLTLIQYQQVDGKWVRGCTLSPDARFLLVTCMQDGGLFVYAIGEDGKLTPTGYGGKQPSAVYATFYQP